MYSWRSLVTLVAFTTSYKAYVSCDETEELDETSINPYLYKRYELVSGDNDKFEQIMEYLGVGWLMRKAIVLAKPVMELTVNGLEYTLSSESFFKNIYTKFKLEEEFEEKTPDGRYVDTMFVMDGNKLVQTQRDKKKKLTTIIREFKPTEVRVTVEVDNLSCVRMYKVL